MEKEKHIRYINNIIKILADIEDNAKEINDLKDSHWVAICGAQRLLNEYIDLLKNNKEDKYSVWVGGGEINDEYLTLNEAKTLAEFYKLDGYDDVVIKPQSEKTYTNGIDEDWQVGKWFTGLIPCRIDAPSTLQPAHGYHGKNVVAVHLKNGGYRCCCIDDEKPKTFFLPENTRFIEGWKK